MHLHPVEITPYQLCGFESAILKYNGSWLDLYNWIKYKKNSGDLKIVNSFLKKALDS